MAVKFMKRLALVLALLTAACGYERQPVYADPPPGSYETSSAILQTDDGMLPLRTAAVSEAFFTAAKAPPLVGRFFIPGDYASRVRVAVLSYDLWTQKFGASPKIIGQEISLNGNSAVVVGIAPEGFRLPKDTLLWTPRSGS
jgi:hypothetical protein